MGLIENAVRKHVTGHGSAARLRVCRSESAQILTEAREIDRTLERAERARLEAEAARDRAIYELERIFHFIPALLIFKKIDGTLLRVNENTAKAFGLVPADMEGKNQREFYTPEQCAAFTVDDERIMRTGEGKYGYLEPVMWKGASHTYRTWKIPIYNGAPEPIGIMLFAIDLTLVGDLSVDVLGEVK